MLQINDVMTLKNIGENIFWINVTNFKLLSANTKVVILFDTSTSSIKQKHYHPIQLR